MPNHMKFCGCKTCRNGMHRCSWGGSVVRRIIRKFRRSAKLALRKGEEPDRVIGVPYTD